MRGKIRQRKVQRHALYTKDTQLPEMPMDQTPQPPDFGQQPGAEHEQGQQPAVERNGGGLDGTNSQAIDHGATRPDQRGQHGE